MERTEYDAAFQAGVANAEASQRVEPYAEAPQFAFVPKGKEFQDFEEYLPRPRRIDSNVKFGDKESLIQYLADYGTLDTFVTCDQGSIYATIDGHEKSKDGIAGRASWQQHTAAWVWVLDDDWKKWIANDGRWMSAPEFAEHLEDVRLTVETPDTATLLEAVKDFKTYGVSNLRSTFNPETGHYAFSYETGQSSSEFPHQISLLLRVFKRGRVMQMGARIRFRTRGESLEFGYVLDRPDKVVEEAREGNVNDFMEAFQEAGFTYSVFKASTG